MVVETINKKMNMGLDIGRLPQVVKWSDFFKGHMHLRTKTKCLDLTIESFLKSKGSLV